MVVTERTPKAQESVEGRYSVDILDEKSDLISLREERVTASPLSPLSNGVVSRYLVLGSVSQQQSNFENRMDGRQQRQT